MANLANHTLSAYDAELNRLTTALSDLGSLVEAMVTDAVRAMGSRDAELARSVVHRDLAANRLQAEIDDDAMRILALRNPMAGDLRRTVGSIRVATDLERIGDLAEGIAKRSLGLSDPHARELVGGVVRMGRAVRAQLAKALDAFLREDPRAALQAWMGDGEIDALYNSILRELLTHMMADPARINACTALLFAAKNLERIGDHASNICEHIYFTSTGAQLIEDPAVRELRARQPDASSL